jgi:hypothetical protein
MRTNSLAKFRKEHAEQHIELIKAKNELRDSHFELKQSTEKLNKMCQLCDRQRHEITRLRSLLMAVKVLVRAMGE